MKNKVILTGLFLFLCALPVSSQHKANFELAEKFTSQKLKKMVGSTSIKANWIKNKDKFWYTHENGDGKNWYFVDASKRAKSLLFDQENLAAQLTGMFKKPFNSKDLPLKDFKYDTKKERFTFHVDSIEMTFDIGSRRLVKGDSLKKKPDTKWVSYSPDSTWIAFARKHNLYLMKRGDADSTEIQMSHDGERWYSFQRDDGDTTSKRLPARITWFKGEKKLYATRSDRRKIKALWVINSLKKRPELKTYKYAMPGENEVAQEELAILDIASKEWLKIDVAKYKDQSLGGFQANFGREKYALDAGQLYFYRMARTRDSLEVCRADTKTGNLSVLWSEESKPYFNWRFTDFEIINGGKEFIWWSERTGWGQFYLLDKNGKVKNPITKGHFVAGRISAVDTAKRVIYFEGFGREKGQHPYYTQYYSVGFDGTGMKRLTSADVTHSFTPSDSKHYFVDNYSRANLATRSVLRDARGSVVMDLETTDMSRPVEAGWKMPEIVTVKAADDATDIYGVMYKPFDFDSTRSYPVIAYCYPGPQTEPFPIGFSTRSHMVSLAQLGFVVVSLGNRGGSPLRSRYYHTYGYGNLRDYPLKDNKYGLEQLAARYPFIDISKVGIYGHSGGGFMSTAALLTYPEFYKVAVSSAGNHDNNVYNRWWSEVHNGIKAKKVKKKKGGKKKDAGNSASSGADEKEDEIKWEARIKPNTELAKNLKGKLLLVHGDIDNNVHPANSIRMANALIKAGKRFDFMLMPGQRHGFGKYNPYFERMRWYYFAEHLLGDYRTIVDYNIPEEK